jgi:hypothetical protein
MTTTTTGTATIAPPLFHRLRDAQRRAVHEQEIWSGRSWILICACAHAFLAVHPAFLWFHRSHLPLSGTNAPIHPGVFVAATLLGSVVLAGFGWWARYAPYRAAMGALLAFLALHATLVFLDPHQLLVGAVLEVLLLVGLLQAARVGHRRRRAV